MKKFGTWKWMVVLAVLIGIAYQIDGLVTKNYPSKHEIKDFTMYDQPDGVSCGPTSAMMVLKHYGHKRTLDEIRKIARTDWYMKSGIEIGGTTPEYMVKALENFGVPAKLVVSDMNELRWYVSQNRSPIALVRSGKKTWHFVVVIGYTKDSIITADPSGAKREVLSNSVFEGAWKFESDLYGRDMTTKCPICGGDGTFSKWLGPLGKCDVCAGTGKLPDWWWLLIELGEAKGYMLIVPDKAFDHEGDV